MQQAVRNPALASLALLFGLVACGGGNDNPAPAPAPVAAPAPPPAPAPAPPPGGTLSPATVTGKLLAPDGVTPLANALVYVEGSAIARNGSQPMPLGAPAAGVCGTPPQTDWSYTCSASDGTFTWAGKMPAVAKLVAVKGAFKIEQTLSASSGTMTLGNLLVPAGATRMAVITGTFDSVQNVLAKLGFGSVGSGGQLTLGTEKFDLYNGDGSLPASYKMFEALFQDGDSNGKADIFNYAIVFLNCGVDEAIASDPARLQILRDYVNQGGRLYVSDLAYDFVEQAFPAYIDFEGSNGTPAATAEAIDDAQLGDSDITSDATLDAALSAWLGGVTCGNGASCLNANGTAKIEGFLSGWAVMVGPQANAPSSVRVWVSGPVTFEGQTTPVQRPLTVAFNVGSGRVTYTSYHNEPFNATGFVPVERIMQFLVFEL